MLTTTINLFGIVSPSVKEALVVCAHPGDESFGVGATLGAPLERGATARVRSSLLARPLHRATPAVHSLRFGTRNQGLEQPYSVPTRSDCWCISMLVGSVQPSGTWQVCVACE